MKHDGCVGCKWEGKAETEYPCTKCKMNYKVGVCEGFPDLWEKLEPDNVDDPDYYNGKCSISCIDAMELVFGKGAVSTFALINAFKYLWRYKHKGGDKDLKKAESYLEYCYPQYSDNDVYWKINTMVQEARMDGNKIVKMPEGAENDS